MVCFGAEKRANLFETRAAIGVWKGWNTDLFVMNEIPVVYKLYQTVSYCDGVFERNESLKLSKVGFLPFHPPHTMSFTFSAGTPSFEIIETQWQQTPKGGFLLIALTTSEHLYSEMISKLKEVGFK